MSNLESAIQCFETGGVLLYPTHTLYGLGGDGRNPSVHSKIASIKGRAPQNPFLVLLCSEEQVSELAQNIPESAKRLMDAFWPGELTLLLPAMENLPVELVGSEGLVGIRLATHPVPKAILDRTHGWLLSTSANNSGEPASTTLNHIPEKLIKSVDCAITDGPEPRGEPSSIVAIPSMGKERIVRSGAISEEEIHAILHPH